MSPIGAFLSERTIGDELGRYLLLAVNGKVENDHAIKRSMGKWYCLPKKEVILEI